MYINLTSRIYDISGQLYKTWIKDIQWLNHGYLQNFLDSDCIKKRYPNCYPKRYPIG